MASHQGFRAFLVCLTLSAGQAAFGQASPRTEGANDAGPQRLDANGDALPRGAIARWGTRRFRSPGWVTACKFSPDNRLLATVGEDEVLRIWDVTTGKQVQQVCEQQFNEAKTLAFTPDSKRVFSRNRGNSIRLWDLATGKVELRIDGQPGRGIAKYAVSADGRLLAFSGGDNGVIVVDVKTGRQIIHLGKPPARKEEKPSDKLEKPRRPPDKNEATEGPDLGAISFGEPSQVERVIFATPAAFSPDGKRLLGECGQVFDLTSGKRVFAPRNRAADIWQARYVNERTIATVHVKASDFGFLVTGLRLWDLATGEETRYLPFPFPNRHVESIALSGDGRRLAVAGREGVKLLDVATGKVVLDLPDTPLTFQGFGIVVYRPAFSPDGKTLAVAVANEIRVWDLTTRRRLVPPSGEAGDGMTAWACAPDGKTAATAEGQIVRVRQIPTGKIVKEIHTPEAVSALAYAPDGRSLATGGANGMLRMWDPASTRADRHWPTGLKGPVIGLAFAPPGKTLAYGNAYEDPGVRIWDLAAKREARWLERQWSFCRQLAFSPDGRFLAAGDYSRLFVFDTTDYSTCGHFPPYYGGGFSVFTALAFSPCGNVLAAAQPDRYDLDVILTGLPNAEPWPAPKGLATGVPVSAVAFAPEGRALILGLRDGTIVLWDPATDTQQRWATQSEGGVRSVARVPGSALVVSHHRNGCALVWDLSKPFASLRAWTLAPERRAKHWAGLSAAADRPAYQAMTALAWGGPDTLAFVAAKLRASPLAKMRSSAALIAALDSEDFATREQASSDLIDLGEIAAPCLRHLPRGASAETQRRAKAILDRVMVRSDVSWGPRRVEAGFRAASEIVRAARAITALEMAGTADARKTLQGLAAGGARTWLGEAAATTLERLDRRRREN